MGLRDTTESQNRAELFQGKTDQVTMEISLKKAIIKIVTILNKFLKRGMCINFKSF